MAAPLKLIQLYVFSEDEYSPSVDPESLQILVRHPYTCMCRHANYDSFINLFYSVIYIYTCIHIYIHICRRISNW